MNSKYNAARLLLCPTFSQVIFGYRHMRQLSNSVNISTRQLQKKFSRKFTRDFVRQISSNHYPDNISVLKNRGLIEVSGRDSSKLLQGLITNDMNSVLSTDDGVDVIHSYLLNVQGRILFDVFVYSTDIENKFLVECDLDQRDNLIMHLKRYKLRSKVKFEEKHSLNVLAAFNGQSYTNTLDEPTESTGASVLGGNRIVLDPRLSMLGYRCLVNADDSSPVDAIKNSIPLVDSENSLEMVDEECYQKLRYRLGISEGFDEMENGIPLEHNGALLNSISFQKGCYVGQELVARAHFTGVIRKRVIPLQLLGDNNKILGSNKEELHGSPIYTGKGKRVGKILGLDSSGCGIGLMRLKDCLSKEENSECVELFLQSKNQDPPEEDKIKVLVKRPSWWPKDLQY